MARIAFLNTKKTEQSMGCFGRIVIGVLTLALVFIVFILVAVDGFYKVDTIGRGYYVVGEVGYYSLEYQYFYLGTLHSMPIPYLKAINTDKNWVLTKTVNDEYWIVDKRIKPSFPADFNSWSWGEKIEFFSSHHVITGPLDSLDFEEFVKTKKINDQLKIIVYYHFDICPGYCLVQYDRESWYLAFKGKRTSCFRSSKFTTIHPSPISEFGYYKDCIFCKTLDDTYLIVNTKDNSIRVVDTLSFYTAWEKSSNKLFALPSEWLEVKRNCN